MQIHLQLRELKQDKDDIMALQMSIDERVAEVAILDITSILSFPE